MLNPIRDRMGSAVQEEYVVAPNVIEIIYSRSTVVL